MSDTALLQQILQEVGAIKTQISGIDGKVTSLDEKVSSLDGKVSSLDGKVSSLDEKFSLLNDRVGNLEALTASLDKRTLSIQEELHEFKGNQESFNQASWDLHNQSFVYTSDLKKHYDTLQKQVDDIHAEVVSPWKRRSGRV